MATIIILIGDLGGGKSTFAAFLSLWIRQEFPNAAQVTNVSIDTAHKVEDSLKFIALKLIKGNKQYALDITDESAQAGLESRGSGTKYMESRVITLSRKAHVDLILVSQLLSMLDKRAQWLGNIYILCEAVWLADNPTASPDYFDYTVFDSKLHEQEVFSLSFQDCVEYIFPHMDTDDIPFFATLTKQWEKYYEIEEADWKEFDHIMEEKPLLTPLVRG